MADTFYRPLGGDRWLATFHTTGPWDERAQHGGPPSALLARAVERCEPREDMVVARFTVEILGAVPVAELEARAHVVRPGRRVELVGATLEAGGREVARASAWRVLRTSAPASGDALRLPPPLPPPSAAERAPEWWVDGYLSAVEWRPAVGSFAELGAATMWARLRHPLVPDEEPTGLQRVLALADSGSGVSSGLDQHSWLFVNPELTVHLQRDAVGDWVCLDSATTIGARGAGLATTVLSDLEGPVGVGAQSLLVARR